MLVSKNKTVSYDKNHTQQLAHSSPSLPLPQLQQELPLQETSISPPSSHQNSRLSLTLDEIQSKSGRMFGSISMDEFLANIWNSDDNQVDSQPPPPPPPPPPTCDELPIQSKKAGAETEPVVSQKASLPAPPPFNKKTVDEVWNEIHKDHRPQQNEEANGEIRGSESLKRQQTLGEMTLEDFLIKAGVVQESTLPSLPLKSSPPQQRPASSLPFQDQTGNITNNRSFDASYKMGPAMKMGFSTQQNLGGCLSGSGAAATYQVSSQSQSVAAKDPATGNAAEKCQSPAESSRNSIKKRIIDGPPEVVVERRQRRMLKNRESAARSRARRQAYTVELEAGLSQLRQENERLKEILAEAERKRRQEIARRKHSTKAQKRTEKLRDIRRTVSVAW